MIVYQFCRMNEWLPRNLHEKVVYLNNPFNFNDPTENNFGFRSYSRKENSDDFLNKFFSEIYDKDLFPDWFMAKNSSIKEKIKHKFSESAIKSLFINDLISEGRGEGKGKGKGLKGESVLRKPTNIKVDNLDELEGWEEEFLYKAIKTSQDNFRIACFTKERYNPLMWGHYADGMRGVCVQYNIPDSDVKTVHYGSPYGVSIYNVMTGKVEQEVVRTFLWKNKDWSYEEEVRVIKRTDFYELRKGAVKGVYFGYKCDLSSAKFVCDIARAAHGDEVRFYVVRNSQVDHTFACDEIEAEDVVEKIKTTRGNMRKYRGFLDDKKFSELFAELDD